VTHSSLPPELVTAQLKSLSDHYNSARQLYAHVIAFSGAKQSKQFMELEERLTALLLQVDGVETGGDAGIRAVRKEVVSTIQSALAELGCS